MCGLGILSILKNKTTDRKAPLLRKLSTSLGCVFCSFYSSDKKDEMKK